MSAPPKRSIGRARAKSGNGKEKPGPQWTDQWKHGKGSLWTNDTEATTSSLSASAASPLLKYSSKRTADGSIIETFREDHVGVLLKEDLPITTTTLRVKVICDINSRLSAEIKGFSPKREFGPALQRMIEENQRQHGQKTLGAQIGEASIARIVEKFTQLGEAQDEQRAATGWGRVGLTVIASLDLTGKAVEAVVTTMKNDQIDIKLTGFDLPRVSSTGSYTSLFAEQIAKEIDIVLPSNRRLNKEEYKYYSQKAAVLAGKDPDRLPKPSLLSAFATADDFSAEVTALPAADKAGAKQIPEPSADEDNISGSTEQHVRKEKVTGLKAAQPVFSTAFGILPGFDDVPHDDNEAEQMIGRSKVKALAAQAEPKPRKEPAAQPGQPRKRTVDDAQLESENMTSAKKHQPATTTAGPRKKFIARKTTTSTPQPMTSIDLPRSGSSSSSSDLPMPSTTKVEKPIPTRDEIHNDWVNQSMGKYTVPQLRGYLRQEGMMGSLKSTARRDALLRQVRQMEDPPRDYRSSPPVQSRITQKRIPLSPRRTSSKTTAARRPPASSAARSSPPNGEMDPEFVSELQAYDRVSDAFGPPGYPRPTYASFLAARQRGQDRPM